MINRISVKLVFALFILVGVSSCSEDFNTSSEFKDIPVVFGLLSVSDTAHYIRIERAFLAPGLNAFEVAKIPDSVYYNNLDVKLEDLTTGTLYTMREIDGNLDGYPRQDGPFVQSPNILYKITTNELPLVGGRSYRLLINRGGELPLATSTTRVVDDFRIFGPLEGSNFRFTELSTVRINWEKNNTSFFFDVDIDIRIREINSVAGTNVVNTYNWSLIRQSTQNQITFRGSQFFGFLSSLGLEESAAITRRIEGLDLNISAGGEEFFDFVNLILANSGITSTQEVPEYSNIQEGRGLFSSRIKKTAPNYGLTSESISELKTNPLTQGLNFF